MRRKNNVGVSHEPMVSIIWKTFSQVCKPQKRINKQANKQIKNYLIIFLAEYV